MSATPWVDPRIDLVTVAAARWYLLDRGWQLQPFSRPELLVFAGPLDDDGRPLIQVLPSSEEMLDYRLRLEDLLTALSIIEERPPLDILTDILQSPMSSSARETETATVPALPK